MLNKKECLSLRKQLLTKTDNTWKTKKERDVLDTSLCDRVAQSFYVIFYLYIHI